jgi:ATP-dependent Clp protease protease subunit
MIKYKKSAPKKQDKKEELDNFSDSILLVQETPEKEESRIIGLFGDVAEETCAEVITNLLILSNRGEVPKNERKDKYSHPPIEFYVNTHGGSASDMFAIYDMMRQIRKKCEIHTIGMGKIMSAGVLLLAAGTKGKRKIGANARVMIHSVLGGSEGPLFNIENEFEEIKFVQQAYSKALTKETNLTTKSMNELLKRHVNIYLSAEDAVKYGIADEVI